MKSGLLLEEASNNGISSLTSKLLLKGTKKRSAEQIVNAIESVGGGISPYSGSNSMGISIEVLKPDLPLALEIMSDIVQNSTFDDAWIRREKEAQIAEIRQEREQPVQIAMLNARGKLFGAHPYSMSNYGNESTVTALTRKHLVDFWHRVAVPSNMVLAVFGDVEPEKASNLIKKNFGSLKKLPFTTNKTPSPNFGKAARVTDKQDKEQGVVVIAFPGIDVENPDRPGVEIMNGALSGMGSRLFLRLRDQLALCYYVGVNEMVGLDPGFIYFYIGTEPAKMEEAEREILSEIEKIRKNGITPEELDRSRKGLVGERKMQKQNLSDLALAAALDELYGLGFDYSDKLEAAYQSITSDHVRSLAEKYLSQPSVISIVQPDRSRSKKRPAGSK
jgi:zinc protease